jgi:molybdopterin molybdotransferase
LPHLAPLPAVRVERREALGRVLAEPLAATADLPPVDVSAMDGYAVAAPLSPGERRAVAGVVAAGDPPGRSLEPGTALRVMTGAPVPLGADRVVPFEQTATDGGEVVFVAVPPAGAHIRRRGEVARSGATLLAAGTPLGAEALAVAASQGAARLPVHRPPGVAVLTTGDEIVPPDSSPPPGHLRDSHTDFLLAAGRSLGLELSALGIAPDDRDLLAARVATGLAGHDVLLIGGGVSAGDFDFVEDVLAAAGCETLFDAVAIQPGKPLVAAVRRAADPADRRLVFGLPGNPASVMITWRLVVRPALLRLLGHRSAPLADLIVGELAGDAPGAGARERFLPAVVEVVAGRLRVTPVAARGSHDLAAQARGPALLHVPAHTPARPSGAACQVLLPDTLPMLL